MILSPNYWQVASLDLFMVYEIFCNLKERIALPHAHLDSPKWQQNFMAIKSAKKALIFPLHSL